MSRFSGNFRPGGTLPPSDTQEGGWVPCPVVPLTVSPRRFVAIARAALSSLVTIVVTGSLVRLTGSGLGCDDWPACNERRFVDVTTGHAAIEQVNRLFTGVVAAAVVLAVLASFFVVPRRGILRWLAAGQVAGVAAQVVIGGFVVLTGLNPWSNMVHFLVSVVLVTLAVLLVDESREYRPSGGVGTATVRLALGACATAAVAMLLGTVVTATGPHAGDADAPRFDLDLGSVARLHSASVLACLGLLALLSLRLVRSPDERAVLGGPVQTVLAVGLLQGFVGYLQYFAGVPALLVAVHIALSMAFWIAVVRVARVALIAGRRPSPAGRGSRDRAPGRAAARR